MVKESKVRDENFILVQGWMLNKLHLKGNELLVYACIYGFSQDEQYFTGSVQYLADWTNSTKRGVHKNLISLCNKGFLDKKELYIDGVKQCKYKAVDLDKIGSEQSSPGSEQSSPGSEQSSPGSEQSSPGGSEQSSPGSEQSSPGGSEQSSPNNIDINNIDNNIDIDNIGGNAIYKKTTNLYNDICISLSPLKKITEKRKKAINIILSIYSLEELAGIFKKAEATAYCRGDNARKWKANFDWLIDENNIAKLLEGSYDTTVRREPVPSWMSKEKSPTYEGIDYSELEKEVLANNTDLSERVANLKERLKV